MATSVNEMSASANTVAEQSEIISATVEEQMSIIHELNIVARQLSHDAIALNTGMENFKV